MNKLKCRGPCSKQVSSMRRWAHLEKNSSLVNIGFMHFSKNWSTLAKEISLISNPKRVFLDFLEILGCPVNNPFGFISIGCSMFM